MPIIWKKHNNPIEYQPTIQKMEECVDNIISDKEHDQIWLLEHEPIYTAGTSSDIADFLKPGEIPLVQTGRGGQITYHGPGQRVAYLMLNLNKAFHPEKPDLRKYVNLLEEVIIKALDQFGVKGERRKDRIGIWVVDKKGVEAKIAAIGIRVRKWISYHGIAINVKPNLSHYKNITPCGISEYGVCSLESLGINVSLNEFDNVLKYSFYEVFKNYGE